MPGCLVHAARVLDRGPGDQNRNVRDRDWTSRVGHRVREDGEQGFVFAGSTRHRRVRAGHRRGVDATAAEPAPAASRADGVHGGRARRRRDQGKKSRWSCEGFDARIDARGGDGDARDGDDGWHTRDDDKLGERARVRHDGDAVEARGRDAKNTPGCIRLRRTRASSTSRGISGGRPLHNAIYLDVYIDRRWTNDRGFVRHLRPVGRGQIDAARFSRGPHAPRAGGSRRRPSRRRRRELTIRATRERVRPADGRAARDVHGVGAPHVQRHVASTPGYDAGRDVPNRSRLDA